MPTPRDYSSPFFRKLSYSLLSVVLIGVILFLGKAIILPLLFSILLATLLLPVVNFLERKKIPASISILLPVTVSLLVIAGVLYALSTQIAHFFNDWDSLKGRIEDLVTSAQKWIAQNLNIATGKQEEYINETADKVRTEAPKIAGKTFISVTESISYLILLPIYTFLVLYYRQTIKKFFIKLFETTDYRKVTGILHECTQVSQRYIAGLLMETTIVFTLNSIGFLILGIKYAIFLALFAAILNLVPYVGMLVANIICVTVTLLTSDNSSDALWVAAILAAVQFIDNNIGMPLIVGNNVRINALVTVSGVLAGGALYGIPGMFLAIPGLAVLKVICDRVDDLKAWGILIGDELSTKHHRKPFKLVKRGKKEKN